MSWSCARVHKGRAAPLDRESDAAPVAREPGGTKAREEGKRCGRGTVMSHVRLERYGVRGRLIGLSA
jgi:hypothetical protein